MNHKEVAIYGCGGFGRGIARLAQLSRYRVVCFVDDDPKLQGQVFNGIPALALADARREYPDAEVAVAVNVPTTRERLVAKVAEAGFGFATLVHHRVELSPYIEIGQGTIVREGCCFSVNIALGRHVQLNMDCTVGHDVVMADYATLAPGAHISGYVHLRRCVSVGTGAVIIQGTKDAPMVVGDGAIIGAGACVTKAVPPGATVVGVPARVIKLKA